MTLGLTPHEFSLEQLFDNGTIYEVPPFQREYQWKEEQWNALFDDVVENESGYFLGTLIGVAEEKVAGGKKIQVIDGQQRLTTLAIFLLALINRINALDPKGKAMLKQKQWTNFRIEGCLKNKGGDPVARFIPQHESHNRMDFFSMLYDEGVIEQKFQEPYCGVRRMYKAQTKFKAWIDAYIDDCKDDDEKTEKLVALYDKVMNVVVILITVDTNSHAYQLFESLNNRGMPLSAIDLIKNKLLSRIEDGKIRIPEARLKQWENIIDLIGDEPATQKRFLQQSYNAFRREINKRLKPSAGARSPYHLGTIATQGKLIDIYNAMIGGNSRTASDFLDWLEGVAEIYALVLGRVENKARKGLCAMLKNLVRVQGAPSYALVLFLLKNQDKLQLDDKALVDVVEFLVKYMLRRNVTDYPPTNTMIMRFQDIIAALDEYKVKGTKAVDKIKKLLKSDMANEADFRKGLEGDIYRDNQDCARFVLCALCERARTKEFKFDLWERTDGDRGALIWTIEHIFPEGQAIPPCWVKMIANGDKELAERYRQDYVHKLGNLTITGYNSTLSNKSFADKRDHKDKNGNPIGYNNKLPINVALEKETSWDVGKIQQRTAKLVAEAMKLFAI